MSRTPGMNELVELWDMVSSHIEHNMVASRLQCIFKDLSELNKDEKRKNTLNIILHYVAAYPAPYKAIADTMGVSAPYIIKVLQREAVNFPWLNELMVQQSQAFYKGDFTKELNKGSNKKVLPEGAKL